MGADAPPVGGKKFLEQELNLVWGAVCNEGS